MNRNSHDDLLREDKKWYKEFHSMPITGSCDATNCKSPATRWYGNTSLATCGNKACIEELDDQRNQLEKEIKSEWDD